MSSRGRHWTRQQQRIHSTQWTETLSLIWISLISITLSHLVFDLLFHSYIWYIISLKSTGRWHTCEGGLDQSFQLMCSNGLTGPCYWELEWRKCVDASAGQETGRTVSLGWTISPGRIRTQRPSSLLLLLTFLDLTLITAVGTSAHILQPLWRDHTIFYVMFMVVNLRCLMSVQNKHKEQQLQGWWLSIVECLGGLFRDV